MLLLVQEGQSLCISQNHFRDLSLFHILLVGYNVIVGHALVVYIVSHSLSLPSHVFAVCVHSAIVMRVLHA